MPISDIPGNSREMRSCDRYNVVPVEKGPCNFLTGKLAVVYSLHIVSAGRNVENESVSI